MAWLPVNGISSRLIRAAALLSFVAPMADGQRGPQEYQRIEPPVGAIARSGLELRKETKNASVQKELRQTANTYTASGRIIDAVTGQPLSGVRFVYGRPRTSMDNGGFINFAIAKTRDLGEFKLANLKPGHYAMYVASSLNKSDLYSDPVPFDIADTDVPNLDVLVRHGSTVSGLVIPAGVTNPAALTALTSVKLLAAVPSIGNLRVGIVNFAAIGPDGSFQFVGLRPGNAIINLKTDSESLNGLSILRIERGGVEQKQGIEIKSGEDIADLQIFIADGTSVIRGRVKIEGGALPEGARMLASITNKLRFSNGYAQVDSDGNFAISGLAAGTYEITLNTYYPPPHQGVRLLPTLKQVVKVSDAGESQVLFTIFPGPPGHRAN